MDDLREVVLCLFCSLVQFRTRSGNCRKCRKSLDPPELIEEVVDPVPAAKPMALVCEVGSRLREIRHAQHLTQPQLAERMGVPRTYISKIENAMAIPNPSSIERLAAGLGVPAWELVCTQRDVEERAVATDPFLLEMAPFVSLLTPRLQGFVLAEARHMATKNQGYR